MLAINKKYNVNVLDLNGLRELVPLIDVVGVEITVNFEKFFLFVIYIPPSLPSNYYNVFFDELGTLNYLNNHKVYFIGDFNIPQYANHHESALVDRHISVFNSFLNYFELVQHNFILNINNRLLDLVLTNNSCNVNKCDPEDLLLKEDSHHPALVFDIIIQKAPVNCNISNDSKYFNFRKANFHALYEAIYETDWSFLDETEEVNTACDKFYYTLNNIFALYVPRSVPRKRIYPPWYDRNIITALRQKSQMFKMYKQNGDNAAYNEFKRLRVQIKRDTQLAYSLYMQNIQNNLKTDIKSFWSYIKTKKSTGTLPDRISRAGVEYDSAQEIADTFSEFFRDSFSDPWQASRNSNIDHKYSSGGYIHFEDIQVNTVMSALKKLKPKSTRGPDGIPAFVIRDCANVLAVPLTKIFNMSLKSATFPEVWKLSRISPIYKKGDISHVENYRPITIINNFSKVFENTLHILMHSYVEDQISQHQHGFVQGRSTVTNLFHITQYISEYLDANTQVDVIYTDFSKAFDRLDHSILISKLESAGFSPFLTEFFKSYLSNRTQYVECFGLKSVEIKAVSGVPQGSVLGPLLFLLFINDISDKLDVEILLYADDAKIFCPIHAISDCVHLESNLAKIRDWCQDNNLSLNIEKCSVMSFSRKIHPIQYDYRLNDIALNRPECVRDLGVIFDNRLTFKKHVEHIVQTSYKNLGFVIRNSKGFTDPSVLLLLFNTFVRSKLEYAALIWNPGYNIYKDALENVQRKYLKYVWYVVDGCYPPMGFPQESLLSRFSMDSLETRRKKQAVLFLYRLLQNDITCSFALERISFSVPRLSSRYISTFHLAVPRTNILKYSPLYFACDVYNCLQGKFDLFFTTANEIKRLRF